jgi:hypothetical protein
MRHWAGTRRSAARPVASFLVNWAVAASAAIGRLLGAASRWVRAGYPPDAPKRGHVALLALCGTDLPPWRVVLIADGLRRRGGEATDTDIGAAIVTALDRLPRPTDVERVRAAIADRDN